ncbi:Cys-tRNA(Pro) deacylase [Candidatus Bathyarchaeota archaeon]|nr:Cys-tRNA(Pro) deacylase [Candidatus Bathyarchaeota archaeon]MBL7079251.1 Cys-tRNA(Pro) deacylase [Candidatus Bathyarchaeota archaeon]
MTDDKAPPTQAVAALRKQGIEFTFHFYGYRKDAVTRAAALEVGVDEHSVVKTLVMETGEGDALIVLMHGDSWVSTKSLARQMGVKTVKPSSPKDAERLTGYRVGGISPFGTKMKLPVYIEETILDIPRILINGGRRGFLLELATQDLIKVLNPTPVNVAR